MTRIKTIKIALAVFVLGAGLAGSYLIIKNSASLIKSDKESLISKNINEVKEIFSENPLKWVENDVSAGIFDSNLTENLKESLLKQIKSSDKKSVEETVNDIFNNKQLKLDFISDINDIELKISKNNSIEVKKNYIETIRDTNKKNFGDFKKIYLEVIVDVFQKLDVSSAKKVSDIYKNLAADYLKISVPLDWIEFHKGLIINFRNAETVYSAMVEYLDDPVKGYLALEAIEGIINESQRLQSVLDKNFKELQ